MLNPSSHLSDPLICVDLLMRPLAFETRYRRAELPVENALLLKRGGVGLSFPTIRGFPSVVFGLHNRSRTSWCSMALKEEN